MTATLVGEGSVVDGAVFTTTNELFMVLCEEAGCAGCSGTHRKATGRRFIEFRGGGHVFRGELMPGTGTWEEVNDGS